MVKEKKTRKKKVVDMYFSEREENAVVAYNSTDVVSEKHRIYKDILKKPFDKMAEIVYKRYHSKDNKGDLEIEEIIHYALIHLYQNLHKYDPNRLNKKGKKTKAYSYYQTVLRNFYRDYGKHSYKKMINYLSYEDHYDEIQNMPVFSYEMDVSNDIETKERLINLVIDKIKTRIDTDTSLKKNEIIVGQAIIEILSFWHELPEFKDNNELNQNNKKVSNNFAKNKILFYLKEITNLSTKEIRSSSKLFTELYFFEKNDFYKNEN